MTTDETVSIVTPTVTEWSETRMKTRHTHRAHCQLCARIQAVDADGAVAKHGYTVAYNYFSGTCPGSGEYNLHVDRALADEAVKEARASASRLLMLASAYEAGTAHPIEGWNGEHRREKVMAKWEELSGRLQRYAVERSVSELKSRARVARVYADNLEAMAEKVTGKIDLYPAEKP